MPALDTIQANLPRFSAAPSIIPLFDANSELKANIGSPLSGLAPAQLRQFITIPVAAAAPKAIGFMAVFAYDAGLISCGSAHYMREGDVFISDTNVIATVLRVDNTTEFTADLSKLSSESIVELETLTSLVRLVEYRKAVFYGKKDNRTANTSEIYIGPSTPGAINDLAAFKISPWGSPGDEFIIEAAPGCKLNLNELFLDVVTGGDGVLVILH